MEAEASQKIPALSNLGGFLLFALETKFKPCPLNDPAGSSFPATGSRSGPTCFVGKQQAPAAPGYQLNLLPETPGACWTHQTTKPIGINNGKAIKFQSRLHRASSKVGEARGN
jgi:hypothetical protein